MIPVHLYGRPADVPDFGVPVLEDAAQAHGALDPAAPSAAAAYSFYPTKNLGGIGDGGAVVTDDAALAETVRVLRNHARSTTTTTTRTIGSPANSRLSEVEAAALRVGLRRLAADNARRARGRGRVPRRRARPAVAGAAPAARVPPLRGPGRRS